MTANTPPTGPPQQQPQRGAEKATMTERLASPKYFFGILITVAAIWFIIANSGDVRIHLWVTWITAPMWAVLLLTFIAGGIVGFMLAYRRKKRRRADEQR